MNTNKKNSQQVLEKTIFVANIPYGATDQSIKDCFESFNLTVRSVRIVLDHNTSKSRGIAYVEFYDEISAQNAMHKVNDKGFFGRQLKVTACDPNFANRLNNDRFSTIFSEKTLISESDENTFKSFNYQPIGKELAIYSDSYMQAILGHTHVYKPDKLTQIIAGFSINELFNMLMLVKLLDQKYTSKTSNLLMKYPSISRVLFQAEIMFGLIRTNLSSFSQTNSSYLFSSNNIKNDDVDSCLAFKTSSGYVASPTTLSNDDCSLSNPYVQNWSPKPLYKPLTEVTNNSALAPTHQHALNVIINMSFDQIAQLPDEKRGAVLQIRRQLGIAPFSST